MYFFSRGYMHILCLSRSVGGCAVLAISHHARAPHTHTHTSGEELLYDCSTWQRSLDNKTELSTTGSVRMYLFCEYVQYIG